MICVEALGHDISNVINRVRIEENGCAFFLLPWYSYTSLTQYLKKKVVLLLFCESILLSPYNLCPYLYLFFVHFLFM